MKSLLDMTEPELRRLFNQIATSVQSQLPPNTGFVVIATPWGKGSVAQYVSNVQRDDAAQWMRETIARWEANDFVERGTFPPSPPSPQRDAGDEA